MTRGRPRIDLSQWEQEEQLTILSGLRKSGESMQDIAEYMGISVRTLYSWIKQSDKLNAALSVDLEVANYKIESALYQTAISGNVNAQITWLCNRRPDKWKRNPKPEIEIQSPGVSGVVIASAEDLKRLHPGEQKEKDR